MFEAWILQIVLSEVLHVPTTIETGTPDATVNFYDPLDRFQYGTSHDTLSLEIAQELHLDCTKRDTSNTSYQSCAQFVPEDWDARNAKTQSMLQMGIIDPPQSMGMIGQEAWFVPKFTAKRDPSILNYLGLMGDGDENRHKLAKFFPVPTTWKDYCQQVSKDNCTAPDGVAQRPPNGEHEWDRLFAQDLYTGYFRTTDQNNCTKHPHTCTGHFAE